MSWISVRESIYAIGILSIFFLLNGGHLIGLGSVTDNIAHSGITLAHWLALGWGYVLFMFWQKYI